MGSVCSDQECLRQARRDLWDFFRSGRNFGLAQSAPDRSAYSDTGAADLFSDWLQRTALSAESGSGVAPAPPRPSGGSSAAAILSPSLSREAQSVKLSLC